MSDLLKTLNFASWWELYKFLHANGHAMKDSVKFYPALILDAGEEPKPGILRAHRLDVTYVKAMAFEELLDQLPKAEALELLLETAREVYEKNKEIEPVLLFLKKLKARPK